MSENPKTYELNITIPGQLFEEAPDIRGVYKPFVSNGVESFVEGVMMILISIINMIKLSMTIMMS